MQYYDPPPEEQQRSRLEPHNIISGNLPGSTEIRIGGNQNIKISGKNQNIKITTSSSSTTLGQQTDGNVRLVVNDGSTDVLKLGDLGSSYTGLAFNDSTNDRIFIGKTSGGSYVAKLSQSGYDAKTATDSQLIWSSAFNSFKIVSTGTATIGAIGASATGTAIVTHNLGYIPAVLAYQYDGSTYFTVPFTSFVSGGANDGKMSLNVYVVINSTQLIFYAVTSSFGSSSGLTFKYFIMQETASA